MPDDHPISKIRRVLAHTMIRNQPYDILIQSYMVKNGEGKKDKTATKQIMQLVTQDVCICGHS